MKKLLLFLFLFFLSCAHLNRRDVPHRFTEEELAIWKTYRYAPCEIEKVKLAYVRMSMRSGCAECALYFFRCRHLLDIGEPDGRGIQRRLRPVLKEDSNEN